MDIREIEIFLTVVRVGTFAGAARRLGISAMMASRAVASLEREMGCRLIHRNTHAGSLTSEGNALLPFARSMFDTWVMARAAVMHAPDKVTGTLRMTCTNVFGRAVMVPVLHRLQSEHPQLAIELTLSDDHLDLVDEGLDLAIRFTHPRDSSLIGRKLSDNPRRLYASPRYLERFGTPADLSDLARHQGIRALSMKNWPFIVGTELVQVPVPGNFACNSAEAVKEACIQDMGIALLSHWDVHLEVRKGRLLPVLMEGADPQNLPVWALVPSGKDVPMRVRALLDLLRQALT